MDDQDFSFRFTCKRSGNCCSIPGGIVRVTDADVRNIAVHLGMSEDDPGPLRDLLGADPWPSP